MAREIITQIWCDICLEEETYTSATETPPIILGIWKPRVLALCPVHRKEVYEPLEQVVRELGQILPEQASSEMRRPPGTAPGSGVFPCPDPTCTKHTRPYKHEQSLRNHSKDVHGLNGLKELYAKFSGDGEAALFDARADAGLEEPQPEITSTTCAEMMKEYTGSATDSCDKAYAWPDYKRPRQAMAVHLAKTHGVRGKKHDKGVKASV